VGYHKNEEKLLGKVVITGVAGFLGSHLADKYLDKGWEVVGIDNMIGGDWENIPIGVQFFDHDLTDRTIIDRGYWADTDLIIHAAALAHEGLSVFSPALIVESNVMATVNVATAAAKYNVKRVVFLSSMARYGDLGTLFAEDMTPQPKDPYGIAKLASENLLKNICETHGVEWTVIVPHNIIGSRQKYDDPYRNVASIFANRMLQGKQPIIYGDGTQKRSFTFVADVVEPLYLASLSPDTNGEIINVGPDKESSTILDLAGMVARSLRFDLQPLFVEGRPNEVKIALCSSEKAKKLLGYEAKTSQEDGIAELVGWIESNGAKPFVYHLPLEIVNEKTPLTWVKRMM
jgi:UDP-glucose 4-epimerase